MGTLVLDIETVGVDFETLHEDARAYLLRAAEREPDEAQRAAAAARIVEESSLWPLTARIVAVAWVDADTRRGRVYYESETPDAFDDEAAGAHFEGGSEASALRGFWNDVRGFDRFVTFNGRRFDVPFLMLRSAVHGLRPSRDLRRRGHVDLLDELSFGGSTRRFNLDFYCHAFGIDSPKSEMQGSDVGALYRAGRRRDIARYCLRDAAATAALYARWHDSLCFDDKTGEDVS